MVWALFNSFEQPLRGFAKGPCVFRHRDAVRILGRNMSCEEQS